MKEKLSIDRGLEYYYNKAVEQSEDGYLVEALSNYYMAYSYDPDNFILELEIAATYLELNLYGEAIKVYYRLLSVFDDIDEVYLGIAKCLIAQNKKDEALYYLRMGMDAGVIEKDEGFLEFISTYEGEKFGIVDRKDSSAVLDIAKKMIGSGDIGYAKAILSNIGEDSYQYVEANNYLCVIEICAGKTDKAEQFNRKALEKEPNNVQALASRVVLLDMRNDTMSREQAIRDLLVNVNDGVEESLAQAALCMQQINDDKRCVELFTKYRSLAPYDKNCNLCLAIALYNTGEFYKAKEILVKLQKIFPDDVVTKYYARQITQKTKARFDVISTLPYDTANAWQTKLKEIFAAGKAKDAVKTVLDDDELFEYLIWLYQSDNIGLQIKLVEYLPVEAYMQGFVRELLVNPDVNFRVKKEALKSLLMKVKSKNFEILLSDVMLKVSPIVPEQIKLSKTHREVYWTVFTTYTFISCDFNKKLNKVFAKVSESLARVKKPDKYAFAALIAYESNINKVIGGKYSCCEVFNAEQRIFDQYLNIYQEHINQGKK